MRFRQPCQSGIASRRNISSSFPSSGKLSYRRRFYSSARLRHGNYHNVPIGRTVTCFLSPIKALPLIKNRISRPAVTAGGRTIVFPVTIESGCYLECNGPDDCRLYGPKGELIQQVRPEGEIPILEANDNDIAFICADSAFRPRANVTIITQGNIPLRR